ncbi:hypothetical protein V6N13_059639 [Hibiscus sabdariffa]
MSPRHALPSSWIKRWKLVWTSCLSEGVHLQCRIVKQWGRWAEWQMHVPHGMPWHVALQFWGMYVHSKLLKRVLDPGICSSSSWMRA